jgi:O-antigen/teichoic acid export membrane protein
MALYLLYTRYAKPRWTVDLRFWRQSLAAAAPLFLPNFIRDAGTRLGVVLLGGLVDQDAVGTYGAASMLVERLAVIPDSVCSALFPTMSVTYQKSPQEAAALYRKFFRYFLLLATPIAVGGGIVSSELIELVYGNRFESSPAVLAVLLWGLFGTFFAQLQGWSVAAIHREREAFFVPIVATIVYFVASVTLIPRLGAMGLAIASLGLAAAHLLLFRRIVSVHLSARSTTGDVALRVIAANAVLAAAIWPLRSYPIFVTIPLGVLVYVTAALGSGALTRAEAKEFATRVRRRLGR